MSKGMPRYASLPRILREVGTSRRIVAGVILTYEFDRYRLPVRNF